MRLPTLSAQTISVVVADDHEIVRDGICALLEDASNPLTMVFVPIAVVGNGLEAIAAVKRDKPDLLFLDLSMPLAGGFEIIGDVRRWSPDTKIVVFTGVSSASLLAGTVEAGVDAIFAKSAPPKLVIEKLPLIAASKSGAKFIAPDLVEVIKRGQRLDELTQRERQTLNMIIAGKTTKEIAEQLFLSPKTVDKHRVALMKKLDVHSVAQLMARALKDGLIDPG